MQLFGRKITKLAAAIEVAKCRYSSSRRLQLARQEGAIRIWKELQLCSFRTTSTSTSNHPPSPAPSSAVNYCNHHHRLSPIAGHCSSTCNCNYSFNQIAANVNDATIVVCYSTCITTCTFMRSDKQITNLINSKCLKLFQQPTYKALFFSFSFFFGVENVFLDK